jgi:hypothetical protein
MRRNDKRERIAMMHDRLSRLGVSYHDQEALRRIEMALSRWGERECNGEVERDETTGKVFATYNREGPGPIKRYPTADKEAGALRRLAKIMASYPSLLAYHQGDPRGCSLYIVKADDVKPGESLDCVYTRGVAVCY